LELLGVWKFYCVVPAIARGFLMGLKNQLYRNDFRDEGGVLVALNLLSRRAWVC
jgi:hypothetical protein